MKDSISGLTTARLETLSDGIFAFAMTLLILDIHVPSPGLLSNHSLLQLLLGLWPNVQSYVTSFMLLGVSWMGHHNMFHYLKRINRIFLWINIVYLMSIAFIPFSTSLLGTFGNQETAILFFGINLTVSAAFLYWMWGYAAKDRHLVAHDLDLMIVSLTQKRILSGILLYMIVMGLSFYSTQLSRILYFLVPLLFIFPGKVDRYFSHQSTGD